MKVLQVIDRLNIGGAEKVMLTITKLLADKGVDTGVLIFNPGFPLDKDIDKRARLFILGRKNKYSLASLYQANTFCSGYDIVHVHMRHCYTYIKLAQLLFRGKYKIILHDHYGDIEMDKSIPMGWNLIFKPRYYIGVSNTLVSWALNTLKTNPAKTYLLSNTIIPDTSVSHHTPLQNKAVMVANIRQTKHIEFAVSLFNQLDWELDIYGNKTDEDYYNKVIALINSNPKIKIIQGVSNLSTIYNRYSIAVHCGVSETGPLVLLEYLAYGIPFIAYKTGEVADVVSKELPILFMDSFNTEDWIARIYEISRRDDLPPKLTAIFKQYFSPAKYIDKCLEIYRDVNC